MTDKPCIVITSLMRGNGPTGVEVHFNLIREAAEAQGYLTELVTPYSSAPLIQRFCNWVTNRWKRINVERAHIWLRKTHRRRLTRHLRAALRTHRHDCVIIYTQDPLSAEVALSNRVPWVKQIVCVIHSKIQT
ncbi:MAG: hypothetical protein AAF420_15170, partial [Pseudomonadota bacterium]